MRTFRARRAWIWLHKWMGLILGANLALIGLTGSIIVFERELDAALHLALYTPQPGLPRLPASAILAIASASGPEPLAFLSPPDAVQPVWTAFRSRDGEEWITTVDPGTGAVLGSYNSDRSLAFIIYRLHSDLLLRAWWGDQFVGVLGLVLLVSAGSGIYLWWPRARFWRAMATVRRHPAQRFYLDLHNVAGVWVSALLLIVAFSGVAVVFPGLVRPIVSVASPVRPSPRIQAIARAEPYSVSLDQVIATALARMPGAQLAGISVAGPPDHVWRLALRWPDWDGAVRYDGFVWIDPWSGAVLEDRTPAKLSNGERFMGVQLWVHNGAVAGMPGRLLTLLCGLSLPALFVTGMLLWLRKRRVRERSQHTRDLARGASMSRSECRHPARTP